MRQLPAELASILKDGLRGARYAMRHGAKVGQEATAFMPGAPGIARLADTVITATEKTASVLLAGRLPDLEETTRIGDVLAAMLAEHDAAKRKHLFIRLHYRLIEAVLRRLSVENAFICERDIALAYGTLHRRGRLAQPGLGAGRDANPADVLRFWLLAAAALGKRKPLREIDIPAGNTPQAHLLAQSPAPYCLLIVALTGAIVATQPASPSVDDADDLDRIIDSATAVVTARFETIKRLFVSSADFEPILRELAALLPLLP